MAPVKVAKTSEHVFDSQWSPDGSRIACSLVTGQVEIFDASQSELSEPFTWRRHKESCRSVRYFDDGRLLSCSSDGSLACGKEEVATWTRKAVKKGTGVNSLLTWGENCFVCGDDDGLIEVYDLRMSASDGPTIHFKEQTDYVSDMLFGREDHLVAGNGDMTLGVYDLRRKKLFALSDEQDDELLSLALMKNGEKVVCSGQTGTLTIFQWGDFGDQKDRIPGHSESVDCIAKIREDALVTGSSDGKLRLVSVYSKGLGNRVVNLLGPHEENLGEVVGLALSPDAKQLVSCSQDQLIRLWSVENMLEEMDALVDPEQGNKPSKIRKTEKNVKKLGAKAFFDEM